MGDSGGRPDHFGAVLKHARLARGMTLDDLAFAVRPAIPKMSGPWVRKIERGERPVTVEAMATFLRAVGLEPADVPAYKLAAIRRLFDESEVGIEAAWENFRALRGALDGLLARMGDDIPPPSPSESPQSSTNGERGQRREGRRSR